MELFTLIELQFVTNLNCTINISASERSPKNSLKSSVVNSTSRPRRYFVIKSFTYRHLEISVQKSIWATQSHNESKLNEAFDVSDFDNGDLNWTYEEQSTELGCDFDFLCQQQPSFSRIL